MAPPLERSHAPLGDAALIHRTPAPLGQLRRLGAFGVIAALACGCAAAVSTGDASDSALAVTDGRPTGVDALLSDTVASDAAPPDAPASDGGTRRRATIAAGVSHTCALVRGAVRCWGVYQQSHLAFSGEFLPTTEIVPITDEVVELAAGGAHACAVLADGSVRCWGDNRYGVLGDGTAEVRSTPVTVNGLDDVVQVSVGSMDTCALRRDGTVRCWGANQHGECGDGSRTPRPTPVEVGGLRDVVEISLGLSTSCALLRDGTVRCWGVVVPWATSGGMDIVTSPVGIPGLRDVVELDPGASSTAPYSLLCARLRDNTVRCLGPNDVGQLGDGTREPRSMPVAVVGLREVAQLDMGLHGCALRQDGSVWCWGYNWFGALGDGSSSNVRAAPVAVVGLRDAVEITAGTYHTCARLRDDTLRCWGYNARGQTMAGGCCAGTLCGLPDGASCGATTDGLGTCADGWCSGCGGAGQPCCTPARTAGQVCRPLNLCRDGRCEACGRLGEQCCAGTCGDANSVCFGNRCVEAGRPGAPCLAGNACTGGCCVLRGHSEFVCAAVGTACPAPAGTVGGSCSVGGSCGACGGLDQPCCPSQSSRIPFYCSAPGVRCGAAMRCVAM